MIPSACHNPRLESVSRRFASLLSLVFVIALAPPLAAQPPTGYATRQDVRAFIRENKVACAPLTHYDRRSRGAEAYWKVAMELVERT